MLDVLLTLCNVLVIFVFLYSTASLAVIGTAELIQRIILGGGQEGLQDEEVMRLITPPLVSGAWLLVAWWFGMGTSIAVAL